VPDTVATIFVVDDDDSVRRGLARVLRANGLRVETFASADDYLAHTAYQGLGCIVLDLRMPGLTGLDLQARLVEAAPALPIVFLSGHGDVHSSVQAMKHGAVDFLTKPVDEEALLAAIREALSRHARAQQAQSERAVVQARIDTLTARELEVLRCVVTGAPNRQIAAHLGISEKTVKVHRGRLMTKLEAGSVAELVRLCTQADIAPASMP